MLDSSIVEDRASAVANDNEEILVDFSYPKNLFGKYCLYCRENLFVS